MKNWYTREVFCLFPINSSVVICSPTSSVTTGVEVVISSPWTSDEGHKVGSWSNSDLPRYPSPQMGHRMDASVVETRGERHRSPPTCLCGNPLRRDVSLFQKSGVEGSRFTILLRTPDFLNPPCASNRVM